MKHLFFVENKLLFLCVVAELKKKKDFLKILHENYVITVTE